MHYLNRITFWQLIFITLTTSLSAQNINSRDYYRTAGELGVFLYLQYGLHTDVSNLGEMKPNNFDNYFRDRSRWSIKNMETAKNASDLLLYGIFVGSIPITPLLSKDDYMSMLLTNLEVISLNGTVTNIVKNIVKRQRPASYFKTRDEGEDAYKSFFSGHTSTAFAIGTSNAIMLSRNYPNKKTHIWTGAMGLALATGYFRLAADKHYMSDVITGAITGVLIGRFVQNKRSKDYLSVNLSEKAQSVELRIAFKVN